MWIWVNTISKITTLKTEIARSVRGPKLQGPVQKTHWRSRTSCRKFWWLDNSRSQSSQWKLWISKQSSICNRGAGLGNPVVTVVPVQNQKLLRKHKGACKSSWSQIGKKSLEFGKACEDLSWNHCTSTPHRSETNGIAERAVRRVKEGTSAVLLQSGLDENWWADFMECYTYLRNMQDLLSDGETHMRDVLGNHLKDRSFRLVHWLSITPSLRKTSQVSINLERKSYLDCSSDTLCMWVEFGRWRTDRRPSGVGNDGRIRNPLGKTQCKSGDISQRNGKFMFPAADGRIKLLGGDQELRTSTLIRERPIRGESHVDFLGESEGSLPPPQDSLPDAGEAINDFCAMSGSFIYRHHVEPRVQLFSPREESFPIPLNYIDVSRTTHTNLDVKQERRIDDYWNIVGSRDLSDYWTGFTQLILLEENPPDGYVWSGWRLTRKQLTSRLDHSWPELWTKLRRNAELKERQKWSHEKPKLDNARKLRGVYFIDPEDKEFKETIMNARKKLETPVALVMPFKTSKKSQHGWLVLHPMRPNQNLRVFRKPVNPQDCVWEILHRIIMKTILQERRTIHCNITICAHIYSYASSHENSRSKGSSG